jgi:Na+/melibiose symporter-like transporter
MLTLAQKIGMTFALILSCCVLAMISFAAGWENMPVNHKKVILMSGYFVAALLAISSFILLIVFMCIRARSKSAIEAEEYNIRMAEQFNVSYENFIDYEDYRNLSSGIRK